ncbi:HAD hydrolase-like protein [Bacillus thuringiensis]|uniref:HAD hydrolase-like protein n=1 Tax=Bacillus thuringiensis TaxID=1428 RepID=UPI002DB6728B|nr:HAD hydrolase-like protein [Bacillus thuringiensis]MEC3032858.1 HAD hydrolase-like protein [Bacillus thuringiensis]
MNILWDFDGTLFDTYPAYTMMLSEILGDSVEKQEIYKNLKISYSYAIQYYNISCEQEDKINVLKGKFTPYDMEPFAGVVEVLRFANKNVLMPPTDRKGVMAILKYYGWEKYFVDMVTIDDGFPRKPNSLAYNHLHKKYNIDLAIGDRELDLLPAKELGISTCMFQGNCDVADYSLSHYSEFFKVVINREFSL